MDTKPSYPLDYIMSNHCHVLELQEVPSKYSQQDINFRKLWRFECYLGTASICTLNYYSIKGFYCFLFIKSRVKRLRNFLCKFKQKIVKYVLLLRFFSCSHCMGLKNTIFVFYVTQKPSHAMLCQQSPQIGLTFSSYWIALAMICLQGGNFTSLGQTVQVENNRLSFW